MNEEKTSWIEGKRKVIVSILGILSTVGLAFGLSAVKMESYVQVITVLMPTVLALIYDIYNLQSKKEYTKQVEAEAQVIMAAEVAPAVKPAQLPLPAAPVSNISDESKWAYPVYFPTDWNKERQDIKDAIDMEWVGWVRSGKMVGYYNENATIETARASQSDRTSNNPSMVYGQSLKRAQALQTRSTAESIEYHKQILLPAAEAALLDFEQQRGGKICNWPASPMAAEWVSRAKAHISAMEEIQTNKWYDFAGFGVWEAGEVAKAWVIDKVVWCTTNNKDGTPKDWKYPDKPEGWTQPRINLLG